MESLAALKSSHVDARLRRADLQLRAFLIGTKIQRSISPAIHNSLFLKLGLNARYSLLDLNEGELAPAIKKLESAGDVLGFNVTAPFKETIISFLSSLDSSARAIGAVNTVKVSGSGKMRGYNTDIYGIDASLSELGISSADKKAVVLGAGGAARACIFVLLSRGFESITVLNRSEKRAKNLIIDFKTARFSSAELKTFNLESAFFKDELRACNLVINAISDESAGGAFPIKIDFKTAKRTVKVFDLGYKRVSPVLRAARLANLTSIDGLLMLAGQATKSFEIWTGISPKRELVLSAATNALGR